MVSGSQATVQRLQRQQQAKILLKVTNSGLVMAMTTDACWLGHFCVEPVIFVSNHVFLCRTRQFCYNNIIKCYNRTSCFLGCNLRKCPVALKETAYNSIVRIFSDYAASIWDLLYNCSGICATAIFKGRGQSDARRHWTWNSLEAIWGVVRFRR